MCLEKSTRSWFDFILWHKPIKSWFPSWNIKILHTNRQIKVYTLNCSSYLICMWASMLNISKFFLRFLILLSWQRSIDFHSVFMKRWIPHSAVRPYLNMHPMMTARSSFMLPFSMTSSKCRHYNGRYVHCICNPENVPHHMHHYRLVLVAAKFRL